MDSEPAENYQLELPYKPSSVSVYWKKITVPKGLPALLENFVRETIRENPDDIYSFLADLTDDLLAKRAEEQEAESGKPSTADTGGADVPSKGKPADEESPLLDSPALIPTSFQLEDQKEPQQSKKEEEVVASTEAPPAQEEDAPPETLFKGDENEVEAATKLQANFRGYKTRKSLREKLDQDQQQGEDQSQNETEETSSTDDKKDTTLAAEPLFDEIVAATKLQAGFRGFLTRKALKEQKEQKPEEEQQAEEPTNKDVDGGQDDNANASSASPTALEEPLAEEVVAATKLQAGFRGFQTRKALREQKEQEVERQPEQGEEQQQNQDQLESSPRPVEPEVKSSTVDELSKENITENGASDAQEVVGKSPSPPPDISSPPATTSPDPLEEEVNDEEIAAEIKPPLEMIREESFDQSSVSHEVRNVTTEVEVENGKIVDTEEAVATPEEDVEILTVASPDNVKADTPSSVETDIEDQIIKTVSLFPITKPQPGYVEPVDEKKPNVHIISTEEVDAALGGLLDETDDDEEESGSDPSLVEDVGSSKEAGFDAGDSNNNDTDNKNDELKSSSAENLKDVKDGLAPIQDCDHQPETTVMSTKVVTANNEENNVEDGILSCKNISEQNISAIEDHNEDRVEVVSEEKTPNILEEHTKEEGAVVEPQEMINLSSSEDAGNANDQIAICADENGEDKKGVGDNAVIDDVDVTAGEDDDKNTKKDDDAKADDLVDSDSKENIKNEEETDAEKNTPNIINVPSPTPTAPQEQEVGQQANDDHHDETDQVDAEEKSESIQLQQSNASAFTESSVDREDTDIATPTDFSNHEEKELLNLEELKKFASNFESEMEPTSSADGGSPPTGTENVQTPVPPETEQKKIEEKASSSEQTESSSPQEVLQVEVKPTNDTADNVPVEIVATQVAEAVLATVPDEKLDGSSAETIPSDSAAPPQQQDSANPAQPSEETKQPEVDAKPSDSIETTLKEPESVAPATPAETPTESLAQIQDSTPVLSPEPPIPILKPESEAVAEAESPQENQSSPLASTEQVSSPTQEPEVLAKDSNQVTTEPPLPSESTGETPNPESEPAETKPEEKKQEVAPSPDNAGASTTEESSAKADEPATSPDAIVPEKVTEATSEKPTEQPSAEPSSVQPTPSETPQVQSPAPETPQVQSPAPETPQVQSPAPETPQVQSPVPETPQVQSPVPETPQVQSPVPETPQVQSPPPESPQVQSPTPETPQVQSPPPESPQVQSPTPETPQVQSPPPEVVPQVQSPTPEATKELPSPPSESQATQPEEKQSAAEIAQADTAPVDAVSPPPDSAPSPAPEQAQSAPVPSETVPETQAIEPTKTETSPSPNSASIAAPGEAENKPALVEPEPASETKPSPPIAPTEQPPSDSSTNKTEETASTNESVSNADAAAPIGGPIDGATVNAAPTGSGNDGSAPVNNSNQSPEAPSVKSPEPSNDVVATPSEKIDNTTKEEEASSDIVKEEELEVKPEKPAVKPRIHKQAKSLTTESTTEQTSPSASPVLRRPKSGPGRSRATTSKYRSGIVIDNQMSMDEMEKEIENEMLTSAAVKIQAGFRGFKTRKELHSQLVSKEKKADCEESATDIASASDTVSNVESASAPAQDEIFEAQLPPEKEVCDGNDNDEREAAILALRGSQKPPLAIIRSLSFPGSHDLGTASVVADILEFDEGDEDRMLNPTPDIDLDLDPDYINRAATRIQANFRGYQVRKSIKRPPSGKENNGDNNSFKNQRMSEVGVEDIAAEVIQRLQERNDDNENEQPVESEKAAAKIQASFRSYKERQKYHQKKKAAITIQATIRGYLTRKRLANMRRRSFQRRRSSAKSFQKEIEDIKKVNDAATKIQAVFRGYQVRSKILPRSSSMIDEREQVIDE